MREVMLSWWPIALRLSPAASRSWTVAWLARVRSAKRCPLGQGEPEGLRTAPARGQAGLDLAPGPAGIRGGLRRTVLQPRSGCARDATCPRPVPPAVPRPLRLRRRTAPDRGRPPPPRAVSRAKPRGWTPPCRAAGPLETGFRCRPGQSRSDAPCVAYSSTPTTRGAGTSGSGNASTSLSTVLRLTDTPKTRARRAPARPASARPTAASVDRRRSVRRPYRRVKPGNCSAKVRRPHEMTGQRNLRTRKQRATRLPPLGTSAGNRR